MVQVRKKLTTPEAERMGLAAAREWERERQREQAEFDKHQEKQRCKEDFVRPLLGAGVSQRDAEQAYLQHVLENAKARSQSARAAHWAARSRAV
jgi:hypothetical protein